MQNTHETKLEDLLSPKVMNIFMFSAVGFVTGAIGGGGLAVYHSVSVKDPTDFETISIILAGAFIGALLLGGLGYLINKDSGPKASQNVNQTAAEVTETRTEVFNQGNINS